MSPNVNGRPSGFRHVGLLRIALPVRTVLSDQNACVIACMTRVQIVVMYGDGQATWTRGTAAFRYWPTTGAGGTVKAAKRRRKGG
jgi:hypothetical protein